MAHYIDRFPGREIHLSGKKYLYFGGTAYLGLQTDTEFQSIFIDNLKKYGTNYGASRKSNIRFSIFGQAENYLAKLVGSEACVTLSSGYLAGQFVSHSFNTSDYKMFYAPNTHSAMNLPISGKGFKENAPYASFEALKEAIELHLLKERNVTPIVLFDSLDFSGINYPDFEGLKLLPLKEIILKADDSHGIGVVGKNGGGVYHILKDLYPKELIVCCSLGKGFAIQAGAVFASKKRIEQLKKTAFFGGASPAMPSSLVTLLESGHIYLKKRKSLLKNTQLFLDGLVSKKVFVFMKNHPAFSILNPDLIPYLEEHRIMVSNFNYPSEDVNSMGRIVLSAHHTGDDIENLLVSVNSFPYH